jgi:hypothetical protein
MPGPLQRVFVSTNKRSNDGAQWHPHRATNNTVSIDGARVQ